MISKTIVLVGPLPPPVHGAALITKRAGDRLLAAGFQLTLCDTSPGHARSRLQHHFNRVSAYARISQIIIRQRTIATVYMSLSGGYGLLYDLMLVALARLRKARIVFHHHSFAYLRKRSPILRAIVRLAGASQFHIALCPAMAGKLSELYGPHLKTAVVSNLAFFDLPSVEMRSRDRALRSVGYLSNISLEKGIDRFLDLMAELRGRGCRVTGRIAGPCADAAMENYIKRRAGEIGQIEYVGPVYDDAKSRFLSSIDVLVFPTRYVNEAQPVVIYEAQAAGVIVSASNRGCIANMVPEELLVDANAADLDELIERIQGWEKSGMNFHAALNEAEKHRATLFDQREDDARTFLEIFESHADT